MKNLFSRTKKVSLMIVLPLLVLVISSFDGGKQNNLRKLQGPLVQTAKHPDQIYYNSQEHTLIVDRAVSRVQVPNGIKFPSGVYFRTKSEQDPDVAANYHSSWVAAKKLAVGYSTNAEKDYDPYKEKVQDNYYWSPESAPSTFGQLKYNKKNHIEDVSICPDRFLRIHAIVGDKKEFFSLGCLAALYGDFRRTVSGDGNGDCYLTHDKTQTIHFGRGNTSSQYKPDDISVSNYLHYIAFGLWPPFGEHGNNNGNTANDDEYGEAAWWGDEMMRLANVNETHFSNAAVAWYVGMHRLALVYMEKATKDPKYLIQALHYEASALHSLTDLFAFGHVVTNRDESSYDAIKGYGLLKAKPYLWMENVIKMGGGTRLADGKIKLSARNLPLIIDKSNPRKDYMNSYLPNADKPWAYREHNNHDTYNDGGATVKNFNGDKFKIHGDGKLHFMSIEDRKVIETSVTKSVQSLFDAYVKIKDEHKTINDIGKSGDYFEALKFLPVYIESDYYQYFTGRWTLYAGYVKNITGLGPMPSNWEQCQIPFLSGKELGWPSEQPGPCATFR